MFMRSAIYNSSFVFPAHRPARENAISKGRSATSRSLKLTSLSLSPMVMLDLVNPTARSVCPTGSLHRGKKGRMIAC